ncbi:SH3 domain-containing protein [Geobacter sp. FeAm09]|uniref:SH3 domain-containing protein n=1 Tax=Geobacter sp. FeAm09 TaxID=2597769 RepID=UPI0011EF1B02|nr:SH3 domain-containing protein [Geobacter sp. FeAm09]QEM68558.1 SH3 domain-containing protein [Geobacter sp. FeAm09]
MSSEDDYETESKQQRLESVNDSDINSSNNNDDAHKMINKTATSRIAKINSLGEARFGTDYRDKLGLAGMSSKIEAMGLTENHALKAARLGMDYQDRLGLTGMSSKIAAMGLTENHTLKAARLGMDMQDKLGLTGMSSKNAAMGLTENHALKAARLGMDYQDRLGLTGMASKVAAMGLTSGHTLKASMLGMDIQKNQGMLGLASKVAAMGLTENFALKASMLGMDIQKNLGLVGLASKIAAMGLTENHALKTARLGMDYKDKFGLAGMASEVAATGLLHKTLVGIKTPIFQTIVRDMLTSPEIEKAFSHLINENDFDVTAKKLCLDNSNMDSKIYDTNRVNSADITPFDQNKSFLEWYESLNPLSKHAITAVFAILLSIIANLLTPFVENLIHTQKHETKEIIKTIKNSNNESIIIDKQYRFVSATRLYVREKPKIDSAIIATATLGKIVSVEHKKQGWAKISYLDENEDIVIGWVLLRYVSKFKR